MIVRAIRGAITLNEDSPSEVEAQTKTLLKAILSRNEISVDDFVSVFFTCTKDISSLPPAAAARDFGLQDVPLLCAQEMETKGSLPLCIRVMAHVQSDKPRGQLNHVFLRQATKLRPDLAQPGDELA